MKINVHTRFAENCKPSLLYHMYTNVHGKKLNCQSGAILFEMSDHLPTFLSLKIISALQKMKSNINDA